MAVPRGVWPRCGSLSRGLVPAHVSVTRVWRDRSPQAVPVRDSSPTAVATGLRLPYLGRCNSWFRKNFTYPEGLSKIRLCPKRTKVRSDSPPTVTRRCAEVLVALTPNRGTKCLFACGETDVRLSVYCALLTHVPNRGTKAYSRSVFCCSVCAY